jgi:hypothetical protein
MTPQDVLTLIKAILAPRQLSYIEELVIYHSWEGKPYREIALETSYEEGYLKDTGSHLWQLLSESLGCQVTKKRLRSILTEMDQSQLPITIASQPEATLSTTAPLQPPALPELLQQVPYPGSPLPFQSPFYIERPPVEKLAASAIQHPGGLLRIKAPWRMGKTSLINHLLGQSQQLGYHTVMVDIRQVDTTTLVNLDTFFRWFCWSIDQQLNLTCNLNDDWFEDAGSKLNCTTHLQEHVLSQIDSPLVMAIDTGHYLMEYPTIAKNFFSMLRSWYEQTRVRPHWQKLRLILAHVANLDLPLQVHQSPFNVGLLVELPYFNGQQTQRLRQCYSLGEMTGEETAALKSLVDFVGGHPYLIQLAFYWLQAGELSLAQILRTAATNQGIYQEYLRRLWLAIQCDDVLLEAFHRVLKTPDPVYLNPKQADALANMGLVDLMDHQVKLRCELYRAYFNPLLTLECG